jgi:hypothetical protein
MRTLLRCFGIAAILLATAFLLVPFQLILTEARLLLPPAIQLLSDAGRTDQVGTALAATLLLAVPPQDISADRYKNLLERVKKGDPSVDFLELRHAYADSPEYSSIEDSDESTKMFEAFNRKDYAETLAHAQKVLDKDYVDIDAHHMSFLAYREMNDAEHAQFHQNIARNLIRSILSTGDGKSQKTAFEVISTSEEYVILKVLGLQPGSQSLIGENRHDYDRLEAVDPETHLKVTLYFNVDRPMGHLHKIFSK